MADIDYTDEEWRAIPSAPNCSVSSFGRVMRPNGKISAAGANSRGYRNVRLPVGEKPTTLYVHRLVAETFLGKPPSPKHTHVAHKDGSRDNNWKGNLRWATPTENAADRIDHGTHNRGERNHCAKLSDAQTVEIRLSREGAKILSERYGISQSRIVAIRGRLRAANKRSRADAIHRHVRKPALAP